MDAVRHPGQLPIAQESLQIIAGCAIVADHCFWTTDRDDEMKYSLTTREEVDTAFRTAIQEYRSRRQEAIFNDISEVFVQADILSLSFKEKVNLSKTRDKKAKELSEKLITVVKRHRLPKGAQRPREDTSSAAPVE
ncbi:hypothetical protein FRB95_012600 [Tulasnella sp. JGI-2019a]|nr:hypothetical protein FRB93_011800 [Tulasnella sp. JGI-2019a]KAG9034779.1 hypothetical protein FRB95_012600 [Tulasnella sp. JGI-2019a]